MEVLVNGVMVPWYADRPNLIEVFSDDKHPESGPISISVAGAELILVRGTKTESPLLINGRFHMVDDQGAGVGYGAGDPCRRRTRSDEDDTDE